MAQVDIVHDDHGNVVSFAIRTESEQQQTGVKAKEGQTVTTVEVPGHPSEDAEAFTAAIHTHLRRQREG